MLIAPRESDRRSTDFPVGTRVVARPPTVSRTIEGTVVAVVDLYTIIVSVDGIEVAVDTEDCFA